MVLGGAGIKRTCMQAVRKASRQAVPAGGHAVWYSAACLRGVRSHNASAGGRGPVFGPVIRAVWRWVVLIKQHACMQAGRQPGRQTASQAGRQAGRQAALQAGREASKQASTQAWLLWPCPAE